MHARAGDNALVIPSEKPGEFIAQFDALFAHADRVEAMRRAAQQTARERTWPVDFARRTR
ncbi:MAG TPA: hypothetical protein VMW35_16795 [Myxococcota bacterium]|jgi:hypothetical protein|nr:hypothetical protein [Myxococcota bacterium]